MSAAVSSAYGNRFAGQPNYTPSTSLTTPTFEGSGETTEPTWRLKPSWATGVTATDILAHNPLPGGDDDYENPSLLISNDNGSTWSNPPALTNPIAAKPTAVGLAGNNADCFVLADPNANRLIMYWCVGSDPTLYGGQSGNGFWYSICTATNLGTWSARTLLMRTDNSNLLSTEQEPKIVWNPLRNRFWMWTHHDAAGNAIRWRESTSTDPVGTYSQPTICNLNLPAGVEVWHMDVIRETSGRYLMAFCDNGNPRLGWLASSTDGINWKTAPRPVMKDNTWAVNGVYRPSIQPARTGNGYDILVARTQTPTARFGLVRNIPKTEIP